MNDWFSQSFQDQIMSKADVIQATGDAIVSFHEIACLTPRYHFTFSCVVLVFFLMLHKNVLSPDFLQICGSWCLHSYSWCIACYSVLCLLIVLGLVFVQRSESAFSSIQLDVLETNADISV